MNEHSEDARETSLWQTALCCWPKETIIRVVCMNADNFVSAEARLSTRLLLLLHFADINRRLNTSLRPFSLFFSRQFEAKRGGKGNYCGRGFWL